MTASSKLFFTLYFNHFGLHMENYKYDPTISHLKGIFDAFIVNSCSSSYNFIPRMWAGTGDQFISYDDELVAVLSFTFDT